MRSDPAEPELLFRDLLIGVTEFFRDPQAFEGLSTAIEALFERRGWDQPLRVWVPACSTGEEVYTLAIIIRELLDARATNVDVQIFGTDIDDQAIEFARMARYQRVPGFRRSACSAGSSRRTATTPRSGGFAACACSRCTTSPRTRRSPGWT